MTTPWPCSTCGAPGVRNIGTQGHCAAHLTNFYRKLPAHVWDGIGIGLPLGPIDNDGTAELECSLCTAAWTGATFMHCPWCLRAVADMRTWQAELVLTPPEIDPDDTRRDNALEAWAERLANAVHTGIITEKQARRVWNRELDRDTAA